MLTVLDGRFRDACLCRARSIDRHRCLSRPFQIRNIPILDQQVDRARSEDRSRFPSDGLCRRGILREPQFSQRGLGFLDLCLGHLFARATRNETSSVKPRIRCEPGDDFRVEVHPLLRGHCSAPCESIRREKRCFLDADVGRATDGPDARLDPILSDLLGENRPSGSIVPPVANQVGWPIERPSMLVGTCGANVTDSPGRLAPTMGELRFAPGRRDL